MTEHKLTQEDARKLEELMFATDGKIEVQVDRDNAQMLVRWEPQTGSRLARSFGQVRSLVRRVLGKQPASAEQQQLVFDLETLDPAKASIERELLVRECEIGHELGRHWDLLRWNVSKFFLGVETLFLAGCSKGLLMLADGPTFRMQHLLTIGLYLLGIVNIFLCCIWGLRNRGIHGWHRASIQRVLLIEADPRLRDTIKHDTFIIRRMRHTEGTRYIPLHGTGELESWGPPLAFVLLWIGVIVLTWTLT